MHRLKTVPLVARAPLAIAAALAGVLALGGSAQAATYTHYTCRDASGNPAPTEGWYPGASSSYAGTPTDTCSSGGSLRLAWSGDPNLVNGDTAAWSYVPPTNTSVASYQLHRSASIANAGGAFPGSGRPAYERDNQGVRVETCWPDNSCLSAGNHSVPLDASNEVNSSSAMAFFQVLASCRDPQQGGHCGFSDSVDVRIHRAKVTLTDAIDPEITSVSGGLVDGTPASGSKGVNVSATDQGGGVYRTLVEVDGQVLENHVSHANGGRCQEPFQNQVPCKLSVGDSFVFDTTQVPDGDHQVRILVRDATNTNQDAAGPYTVSTRNAPQGASGGSIVAGPGNPNGANASRQVSFRAWHGDHRQRQVRVPYGRPVEIKGSLTSQHGQPITGATLLVEEKVAGSASFTRKRDLKAIGQVRTDGKGEFTYQAPPGPSREVRFAYRAFSNDTELQRSEDVSVLVTAGIKLKVKPRKTVNGKGVKFRGQLLGGPVPQKGVLVDLQAKVGRRWQNFALARASQSGKFKLRYRFRNTSRSQKYRFRAQLREDGSYPYASGASRKVKVKVRGGR